jgi:hypothetical protein
MTGSGGFNLPSPAADYAARELYSFRQESLTVMGLYRPMSTPILIDPVSTKNRTPKATIIHEQRHQLLMDYTDFGIFHTVLELAAKQERRFLDALALSMRAQWSVQELDATYGQIDAVKRFYPDYLPQALASLPSAAQGDPPYKEAYDSVARYLPLSASETETGALAKDALVHTIATWSMSTDCLTRFLNPANFTVLAFRHFLSTQSPHVRFERLMAQLLEQGLLPGLVDVVERGLSEPDPDQITIRLCEIFSSITKEEQRDCQLTTLKNKLDDLLVAWRLKSQDTMGDTIIRTEIPLPTLLPDLRNYQQQVASFESRCTLTPGSLTQEFSGAAARGVGTVFALSTDGHGARIYFGTYTTDESSLYPSSTAPPDPSHKNLWGILPFDDVCRILDNAEPLPQILIFRGIATWNFWLKRARKDMWRGPRVWACTTKFGIDISQIDRMLNFGGIRNGAQCELIARRDSTHGWAFITSANAPDYYVAILCAVDGGLALFGNVARRLGIPIASKPDEPSAVKGFLLQVEEESP